MIYFPLRNRTTRVLTRPQIIQIQQKKPQRRNITTPLSICIITTEHKIQIFEQNKNV